jgi:hypothetical protein
MALGGPARQRPSDGMPLMRAAWAEAPPGGEGAQKAKTHPGAIPGNVV